MGALSCALVQVPSAASWHARSAGRPRHQGFPSWLPALSADSTEVTEHAAYLGMAAMLQGAIFNADIRNPQGRVFSWVDRMLLSTAGPAAPSRFGEWGPPRGVVAQMALRNLLMSNAELASIFVDRSYSSNPHVAAGYFKASWGHCPTAVCVGAAATVVLAILGHTALAMLAGTSSVFCGPACRC